MWRTNNNSCGCISGSHTFVTNYKTKSTKLTQWQLKQRISMWMTSFQEQILMMKQYELQQG